MTDLDLLTRSRRLRPGAPVSLCVALLVAGTTGAVLVGGPVLAGGPVLVGGPVLPGRPAGVHDDRPAPASAPMAAAATPHPGRPWPLRVAAREVPAVVGELLSTDVVGPVLEDDRFPLVDGPRTKVVHFRYADAVASLVIEPADRVAGCQAEAEASQGRCHRADGLDTLVWRDDRGRAQGASVWRHGYVVSLVSYDDAGAGKGPRRRPGGPPISTQDLVRLAGSARWWGRP